MTTTDHGAMLVVDRGRQIKAWIRDVAMLEKVHISIGLRLLALVCKICPCCLIARHWPDSTLAKRFRKVQYLCPFCRAYMRVKILQAEESQQARPVPIRRDDKNPSE